MKITWDYRVWLRDWQILITKRLFVITYMYRHIWLEIALLRQKDACISPEEDFTLVFHFQVCNLAYSNPERVENHSVTLYPLWFLSKRKIYIFVVMWPWGSCDIKIKNFSRSVSKMYLNKIYLKKLKFMWPKNQNLLFCMQ